MFKRQSGFTLIELIVVIVILGILAATALPKFSGIQSGARVAVLSGARGAVSAAMNIAAATQQGQGGLSNTDVTLDGVAFSMVHGYPVATYGLSGIFNLAGLSTVTNDFSAVSAGSTAAAGTLTIGVRNATSAATCSFVYTAASGSTPASVGASTTTGC